MTDEKTPPSIAASIDVMLAQRMKGINKYGVSIEDAGLAAGELLAHAREEAADTSVYLAQLAVAMREDQQRVWRESVALFNAHMAAVTHLRDDLALEYIRDQLAEMTATTAPPECMVMYAQASAVEEWKRMGANLLSLSRSSGFPFNVPIKVMLS
jgi:hypothetical protein